MYTTVNIINKDYIAVALIIKCNVIRLCKVNTELE